MIFGASAFLSYTRTDDEFYGGYITSFRKILENAVHVVTGERTFRVFQDVDGIVVGENWRKRLAEAIHDASFFVPMLTPLFFNSEPCRDEVTQFLEHERSLHRDDLILPIYFFTSARLEKPEETAKDPLAQRFLTRQLFDWRDHIDAPLDQPSARRAIVTLASQIAARAQGLPPVGGAASATTRSHPPPDVGTPRSSSPPQGGRESDATLPGELSPVTTPRVDAAAASAGYGVLAASPALIAGVDGMLQREIRQPKTVLWVDDHPENNHWERRALGSYGVQFVLALNTAEAERAVAERGPFAAIISDLGRGGESKAGLALLGALRKSGVTSPYFIYTAERAAAILQPLVQWSGGQGVTADPDALVEMTIAALHRA